MNDWRPVLIPRPSKDEGMNKVAMYFKLIFIDKHMIAFIHSIIPSFHHSFVPSFLNEGFRSALTYAQGLADAF